MSASTTLRALVSGMRDFRANVLSRLGVSFEGRRDLYASLGYPRTLGFAEYNEWYERGDIAAAIVDAFVNDTWGNGGPVVQDIADTGRRSAFESGWDELNTRLKVLSEFQRADVLACLGRFSILLIGTADGRWNEPLGKLTSPSDIVSLTAFGEDCVEFVNDTDRTSPRLGAPLYYTVTIDKTSAASSLLPAGWGQSPTLKVHYTRVIHCLGTKPTRDRYLSIPLLSRGINRLMDINKVAGAGAEALWQRMNPGLSVNIDDPIGLTPAEEKRLDEEIDDYEHGQKRVLRTIGSTISLLSSPVSNYAPSLLVNIKLLAGAYGIPYRRLVGSEMGELASSQDENNWNRNIANRTHAIAEPELRDFNDRMVSAGALATPETARYSVVWPVIEELTEDQKGKLVTAITLANTYQMKAEGKLVLNSDEIRDTVWGRAPLDDAGDGGSTPSEDGAVQSTAAVDTSSRFERLTADEKAEPWSVVFSVADRQAPILRTGLLSLWQSAGTDFLDEAADDYDSIESAADDAVDRVLTESASLFTAHITGTITKVGRAIWKDAVKNQSFKGKVRASADLSLAAKAEITGTFDSKNARVSEWASSRAGELITEISPSTRDAVRELIATAHRDGIPPAKIKKLVSEVVGLRSDQVETLSNFAARLRDRGLSEAAIAKRQLAYAKQLRNTRADLIAWTETGRAANQGTLIAWQQARDEGHLRKNQQREWIVTWDERLRPEHEKLAGATASLDKSFDRPGGGSIEPGEDPRCRCAAGLA